VDAGVDQYLFGEKVRFSATWFYTRIVQITQFDSASSVVRAPSDPFGRTSGYFNGAGGTSRGAELSIETRPFRSSLARASYSYVNADADQDTAVPGFFQALSVPAHSFNAFWNQQIGRKTGVTFDLYHAGEYYNSLSAAGRARAYLYPSLTKIDAVFSRDLRTSEKYQLKGYAKVDNILNQRYFENGFGAPRATVTAGLRILFP
jgi:iron complex outermembrane receptor protein